VTHRIQDYIDLVRSGKYPVCEEQHLLCDLVEAELRSGRVYVNEEQLEKYLSYQKYFPYDLFPWEVFCFALHNCVYWKDSDQLRWPMLMIYIGRGGGKNGYLAFEDFCLLTSTNGIQKYHIDIFAMSEKQAKASWQDVYDVLEANKKKMEKHFRWTKELILNTDTNSEFCFNTSSPKTKDGFRPGKVDFDEVHAYENYKLMDVATTGLGKVPRPRRTYITTDGLVRGGVLDDLKSKMKKILTGEKADNGWLPFFCHVESEEEIKDPAMWYKANPSLQYLPHLLYEIQMEFADYLDDPIGNISFSTKRMNFPPKAGEDNITTWDNVLATNQEIDHDELRGRSCFAGIDYMSTTDFLSAGLLFKYDGQVKWVTHTWVCRQSRDLKKIKAPLEQWEAMGLLTFVDAPEIPADLPACWLRMKESELGCHIIGVGIDQYRYQMMRNALEAQGFVWDKKYGDIYLLRPSNEMQVAPIITSEFVNGAIAFGDNPLMRWAVWNSKMEVSKVGNITYGKIEPHSRKTDPFKAYVAAECVALILAEDGSDIETEYESEFGTNGVMTF